MLSSGSQPDRQFTLSTHYARELFPPSTLLHEPIPFSPFFRSPVTPSSRHPAFAMGIANSSTLTARNVVGLHYPSACGQYQQ
jgi:hypothetical protein